MYAPPPLLHSYRTSWFKCILSLQGLIYLKIIALVTKSKEKMENNYLTLFELSKNLISTFSGRHLIMDEIFF